MIFRVSTCPVLNLPADPLPHGVYYIYPTIKVEIRIIRTSLTDAGFTSTSFENWLKFSELLL